MAIEPSVALPISVPYDGNLLDNPKLERHLLCGRGAAPVGGVTIRMRCQESLECIGILLLRFGSCGRILGSA
jgi:hypothetical protein